MSGTATTIVIKVTPAEFDLLRNELRGAAGDAKDGYADPQANAPERAASREREALIMALLDKLG